MDDSFKLKPGRSTPRMRSATPKGARTTSKGLDQQKMMSFIYGNLTSGQTFGTERMKHSLSEQALAKSTSRTPVYKTQEEYYDEVLVLKKKIKELTADNSTQKLKVRRLEEDFQKKEKQVEQLLDPLKNNETRRTLADGKTDSGTVVHSLKQKIHKLEQQLREKESAYSKLQSDLKTTKIEEMKIQLETFYNEMIRLKTEKSTQPDQTLRDGIAPKAGAVRVKELTATILKMSVEKTRLLAENKSLKEDLQKCIETKSENKGKNNAGLTQKQIMSALAKLEQKFDKFETVDGVKSRETDGNAVNGGVVATTAEEVQQLRQREVELKEEVARQMSVIESIKQDRAYYVEMCQKKDNEIASLKREVDDLRTANSNSNSHRRDSTHGTPSLPPYPVEERETPRPKERLSRRNSASVSSAIDTGREILEKVKQFKRNRAAKVIQKNWTQHKVKEIVKDEAAELIQESWRGHRARKETNHRLEAEESERERKAEKDEKVAEIAQKERIENEKEAKRIENAHKEMEERKSDKVQNGMERSEKRREKAKDEKRMIGDVGKENERHDVDNDDSIEVIQSTFRAHRFRNDQIKANATNSQTSQPPKDKSTSAESSSAQRTVSSRSKFIPLSDDDDIDDEIDEDIEENISDEEDDDNVKPMIIK